MEWHDFRKERPTKNDDYLIKIKAPNALDYYTYRVEAWNNRWQVWIFANRKKVVAWAEVPKCDIE